MRVGDGETFQEEKARVSSFLEGLKARPEGCILVVCHAETMQIIEGYFRGLTDAEMWRVKIDNCETRKYSI